MHHYLKLRASIIKMCKGFEESVFSILARLINGNPFIKENFASWTWALKIAINKYLSAGFLHKKSRFSENLKTEKHKKHARRKNAKLHVKTHT